MASVPAQGAGALPPQAQAPEIIPGRYIVTLAAGADPEAVAADHGLAASHAYRSALRGFAAAIPEARLAELRADPRVNSVVPDRAVYALAETTPTGIDRIDAEAVSGSP